MKSKNVLYAAVGAPVVVARKVGARANGIGAKLSEQASEYGTTLGKAIEDWAAEGEKLVGRIGEGKVVDELASMVDLDQAKEQVTKLRDQLEDMLATWRSSFRPERLETPAPVAAREGSQATSTAAKRPAAKKPAAKKPAAKKPAAKKPAAKKPAARSAVAKTSTARTASTTVEKAS